MIILKMREREWWNRKQKGKKTLESISYIDLEGKNMRKDKYVEKLWGRYKQWSYGKVLRWQESWKKLAPSFLLFPDLRGSGESF